MKTKLSLLILYLAVALPSTFGQVPTTGLVRYYPFIGNSFDFSGNGKNATVVGATLTSDRFGHSNSAYSLNANNGDYLTVSPEGLDLPEYSYSVWASLTSAPSYGERFWILSVGSINGDQGITYNNNYMANSGPYNGWGTFSYTAPQKADTIYSGPSSKFNQWHNLVTTKSASEFNFYIDGKLVRCVKTSNAPFYGQGALEASIGIRKWWNHATQFDGKIDDVRIYNRALSEDEVISLNNEGKCFETITVTDTLIINLNAATFNPSTFENSIKIYPNPANDMITINYGNYNSLYGYTLKILNSMGQEVFSNQINKQESTINLSSFTKGLYFVKLIDARENVIEVRKIVLQ